MWPLKSIVLEKWPKTCNLNLQIASQHKKTNKVVWTYEDDRPPKRTSTYERPFTQEGNYLVYALLHRGLFYKRPIKNVATKLAVQAMPIIYSCFLEILFIIQQNNWEQLFGLNDGIPLANCISDVLTDGVQMC